MSYPIRAGSTYKVPIGPAVSIADGFTTTAALTLSGADDAVAILHDNATVVDIAAYTFAAIANASGYYHLTLQTGISNTVGNLTIVVTDVSLILPIKACFQVMTATAYDLLYASTSELTAFNRAAMKCIAYGTVGSASSETSLVTSSITPSSAVADQFKGRIVTFASDTTTTALRCQSTDITANTSGGVLTVTQLTTAPVSGDTFTIQ
jgi:hypothetical protein